MSKVGSWNTTAANNNATPPDGWPEGQAPSTVNDCAREMMAQIKTLANDMQYIDLAHSPTQTGATTFTLPGNVVSTYEVGRRIKAFDVSTYYATIISASFTANTGLTLRLDSGAFTSSLTSVAVAVISETNNSLPNSVWRRKNLIINGSMGIWQRSASFQCANNAITYTADRWLYAQSAAAACNVSRAERSANASNVPTLAQAGAFFNSSLRISVSAVDAAIAAGEYAILEYRVEGYDWRQIAHRPMNLSFWWNTNKSGIYAVAMRDISSSASFVQNFTISTVNTWQKFSIPVPEAPTTVTWDYSTGIGLAVAFTLAAGATYQGGAGNWTATNIIATASQVNFLVSAGNMLMVTGVQLEEGQTATPYEIRPYHEELEMCRRYYQNIPEAGTSGTSSRYYGYAVTTNRALHSFPLIVGMRTNPTVTFPALATITMVDGTGTSIALSGISTLNASPFQIGADVTAVGTPLITGQGNHLFLTAGSVIIVDAEL